MSIVIAMTKRIVPAIATRGRIIAMLLVAASGIAVGLLLRNSDSSARSELTEFVSGFGFVIFVPLVSLVISTAALGTLIEDKTLVYFWLRPIGRWKITAAAFLAGFVVLVPLILLPMGVLGSIPGSDVTVGAIGGAVVGMVAYTSVFTLIGLLTQRALAWGLFYILVWEGLVAGFSETTGRLAIRTYADGAMARIADVNISPDTPALATALIVAAALAVVCFGATTLRLNTMTVD